MGRRLLMFGALLLVALSPALPAAAEGSIVDQTDLDAALARHAQEEQARRDAVLFLVERPEVQAVLDGAGIDPRTARSAVAALDGEELAALGQMTEAFDAHLAGGQGQAGTMSGGTGSYMPILYGVLVLGLILLLVLT